MAQANSSETEYVSVFDKYNIPRRISEIDRNEKQEDDIHDDRETAKRLKSYEIYADLFWIGASLGFAIRMLVRREECMDQFGVDHYLAVSNIALIVATVFKIGFVAF